MLLIRGLGSNADHWYEQIPAFSARYRVVIFDNRGVGRSGKPDCSYTIPMMAGDAVGLLKAIGIPRAHVLGMSMGGMIAQEMALRHPEKVHGLILACTHCGGSQAVRASQEILELFEAYLRTGTPEAAHRAARCLFSEETLQERPDVVEHYQEMSRRLPPEPRMLLHQLEALQGHDTWDALPYIQAPTLVLSGSEDLLVPPENSHLLAQRIPQARLEIIPGGGHQFMVERPEAFNQAVLRFLEELPAESG